MTSEWGTPDLFENGPVLEEIINHNYGHKIHFWDLRRRRHIQEVDLGSEYQMALELRPAHNPTKAYGFVGVVVNANDLSSSVWTWYQENGKWAAAKVIEIPAEPADPDLLPEALKPLGAVPPLVTDIDLSVDDRFLYVSCWGSGELRQYDVSDPFNPKHTGTAHAGGIVRKSAHQKAGPLPGGPQMVEVSRDGAGSTLPTLCIAPGTTRSTRTHRLDGQDERRARRGIELDQDFFVDFGETRAHQVRLEGGDASSDSFCYP